MNEDIDATAPAVETPDKSLATLEAKLFFLTNKVNFLRELLIVFLQDPTKGPDLYEAHVVELREDAGGGE